MIKAVTAQDVMRVTKKYFPDTKMNEVVITPVTEPAAKMEVR